MADRLKQLRVVDPVLTTLARGYSNAAYVCEHLFPVVGVDKEGSIVPLFGKESFRLWETERAIRGASNVMTPNNVDELDVVLREHDLSYPIDYRESAESLFDEETTATNAVTDAIDLGCEVQCARLAQNPGTYLSGAKVVLSGSSQWSGGGGDPLAVVETGKEVVRARIGKRPNTMVLGASAYASLKFHPKMQSALGSQELKLITPEHLRIIFGIPNVQIGEAIAGDSTTSDVWGDNVVLAYVAPPVQGRNRDKREPSFAYNFRKKGFPQIDKYDGAGGKVHFVRNTDIYKPVVVGADAGYLISDVNA